MKHERNRKRDDIQPIPRGPWFVTLYCTCGQSYTSQDRSKQNALSDVNRKLRAHIKSMKGS